MVSGKTVSVPAKFSIPCRQPLIKWFAGKDGCGVGSGNEVKVAASIRANGG